MKFLSLEDELKRPNEATSVLSMNDVDVRSSKTLMALRTCRDALVSLEAMGSYLRKQHPSEIGRHGVLFANIALEQVCTSQKVALESLPFDQTTYDRDPAAAVKAGLAAIDSAKKRMIDQLRDQLTALLVDLSYKRDQLNNQIVTLWHRIADLERLLERNSELLEAYERGEPVHATPITMWPGFMKLVYTPFEDGEQGVKERACADVVPDICHFLTEHSHLFKRLIAKQINWVNDHKANALKGRRGFDEYVFNPIDYQCNGMTDYGFTAVGHPRGAAVVRRSAELPGCRAFYTYAGDAKVFGFAGVEAMAKASCSLGIYNQGRLEEFVNELNNPEVPAVSGRVDAVRQLPVLSKDDCAARLAELKRGVQDLEHWADIAYVKLWKDAYFEQEVMAELLRADTNSSVERGLRLMAEGVLNQLTNASASVGQYVVETFDELLTYVELSLTPQQEVPHA